MLWNLIYFIIQKISKMTIYNLKDGIKIIGVELKSSFIRHIPKDKAKFRMLCAMPRANIRQNSED